MTVTLVEDQKIVGFATYATRQANCPECGATHNITQKHDDAAYKNKRGYTSLKCSCGVRLGIFYCEYDRRYVLEVIKKSK